MAIVWYEWGAEAFARAHRESKPILLSLTAAWCHACRQMDAETWDHPGVEALVERSVVPVKVDADRRPDLYGRYHLGGLPTTVLLTSQAGFVRGGTFLSPPQFMGFLNDGLTTFRTGRRPLPRSAGRRVRTVPPSPEGFAAAQVAAVERRYDPEHAGFALAPKLPHPETLTFLLRQHPATPDAQRMAIRSLEAIADHLWDTGAGGFFRYAAGRDWSQPHTEKLAVDQAALIRLFLEAGSRLGSPRFLGLGRGAVEYALGWLAGPEGVFFGSQAADPSYYALRPAERAREEPPAVDRLGYADATAAMASALTYAAAVLELPQWQARALTAVDRLMRLVPPVPLPHLLLGPSPVSGWLRDQALGIQAAVDAYRVSGRAACLRWAGQLAEWALSHLWDEEHEAFRDLPGDPGPGGGKGPVFTPVVANALMAEALAELGGLERESPFGEWAARLLTTLMTKTDGSVAAPAVALALLRGQGATVEAELAGEPHTAEAQALARAVIRECGPRVRLRWVPGPGPAVTLCTPEACLPPLETGRDLAESLRTLGLSLRSGHSL
ncbi:MAG: DUF255 domain-containing protein [Candidatus Methylomirabilia bacterium]